MFLCGFVEKVIICIFPLHAPRALILISLPRHVSQLKVQLFSVDDAAALPAGPAAVVFRVACMH